MEKYLKAAHFKHARKGLGISDKALQNIRILILIPNFIMMATTLSINKFSWVPFFFTFWGYVISLFSVFASMKAAEYYEWQVAACVSTEVGHALNIIIMPLFWLFLWPGIAEMGWHWDTWQLMMHMITLHSVPFISTSINIAITDIKLLRADYSKVMAAGYVYMVCNLVGQFSFGTPLYPWTEWVANPLMTIVFFVVADSVCALIYWGSTWLIDWYAQWLAAKSEQDEDDDE